MQHPSQKDFEFKLKQLFDQIDGWLENKYSHQYSLHPNRAADGTTANPEMDGLFNIGADFTTGYGSNLGRGYVIQIHLSTLDRIPNKVKQKIRTDVLELVSQKLREYFPNRKLMVGFDGDLLKITGDFRLGSAILE